MPEQPINYNENERKLLRQSKAMKDLVTSEAWAAFKEILNGQIHLRDLMLTTPLMEHKSANPHEDLMGKLVRAETIKGARIGLILARDTPQAIIDQAAEIIRDHETKQPENTDA